MCIIAFFRKSVKCAPLWPLFRFVESDKEIPEQAKNIDNTTK